MTDYQTGARAFEAEDYAQAVAIWQPLAEAGHMVAQKALAVVYDRGYGVAADPARAAYWYGKAGAQGHAVAQLRLAVAYTFGNGVERDYVRAYVWLAHATARFPPGRNRDKAAELATLLGKLMSPEEKKRAESQVDDLRKAGALAPAAAPPRRLELDKPTEFRATVLDFVKRTRLTGDTLFAGTLQMLGFDEVRTAVGTKWPSVKTQIYRVVDQAIESNLSELDLYLRPSDTKIILLFGSALKPEAEALARTIAIEIENLLSAVVPGEVEVNVSAATVGVALGEAAVNLFDAAVLTQAVESAQSKAEAATRERTATLVEHAHVTYWPAAHIQKKLAALYAAEFTPPPGEQAPKDNPGGERDAEIDRFLVDRVGADLAASCRLGHRAVALVPVHYETLANKAMRATLLDICRKLPATAKRRLLLCLIDMPDGVPQNRLFQILSPLAPFLLGFAIKVSYRFKDFDRLQGSKVPLLVVGPADGIQPGKKDIQEIEALVRRAAGKKKMRVLYGWADSLEIALETKRTGVNYIFGASIFPANPRFGRAFNLH